MKKLVLGALCIVLGFAANAAVTTQCQIGDLRYNLDDSTKTAEVCDSMTYMMDLKGDVKIPASVTYMSQDYAVTSIGQGAFIMCSSLESVSAPYVTSIGDSAFVGCSLLASVFAPCVTSIGLSAFSACNSLASLTVNSEMQSGWGSKKNEYGIDGSIVNPDVTFLTTPTLKWDQVAQARYEVKEAVVEATVSVTVVADPSVTLKSKGQEISEEDYAKACEFYGIEQKTKPDVPSTPTAEDFKVVSKDAQVVKEGEIAVTKESLQAAKAEAVTVADGVVSLGVTVNTNGDLTAETKSWQPVELKQENVKVENGKIVISIPVDSQSGFMILQSGDAKVGAGNGPAANHAVQVAGGLYLDGGPEDQLVEVRELDTQVLDNTAVKANDDPSDE